MVFQCINIRQVPWEVLKTAAFGLGFQHFPRDLANVNAWKAMFYRYYCIKTESICYISRYFLYYFVSPFYRCLAVVLVLFVLCEAMWLLAVGFHSVRCLIDVYRGFCLALWFPCDKKRVAFSRVSEFLYLANKNVTFNRKDIQLRFCIYKASILVHIKQLSSNSKLI